MEDEIVLKNNYLNLSIPNQRHFVTGADDKYVWGFIWEFHSNEKRPFRMLKEKFKTRFVRVVEITHIYLER